MKIKNIENPEEFLKIIDSCKGRVELITDDGDRLNLKSKLCQLVSLSTIFSSAAKIPENCSSWIRRFKENNGLLNGLLIDKITV